MCVYYVIIIIAICYPLLNHLFLCDFEQVKHKMTGNKVPKMNQYIIPLLVL